MMKILYSTSKSGVFWLGLSLWLATMLLVAMVYQYKLGLEPCALCVQVRAWVAGAMIIAALIPTMRRYFWFHWLNISAQGALLAGGLYTSWVAWEVENKIRFASCEMNAGFPSYLRLDEWMPAVFEARGMCGSSPELLMGVTMVDGLLIALALPLLVVGGFWLSHLTCLLFNTRSRP